MEGEIGFLFLTRAYAILGHVKQETFLSSLNIDIWRNGYLGKQTQEKWNWPADLREKQRRCEPRS